LGDTIRQSGHGLADNQTVEASMKKREALIVLGLVFGDVDAGFILTPAAFSAEREGAISEELRFLKEEMVSIAVRHEQPISEAPSNVYVITDEDIRQSGATDLPTVLRRIPGLEVMQTTGADINVSARGDNQLSANKLLVMVDGRSIYIDMQGQIYWKMIPVTLPEIKRIEVLKGPASAVYGFNAFDGIINIITKSPEEMKGTTLQFGGGGVRHHYSISNSSRQHRQVWVSSFAWPRSESAVAQPGCAGLSCSQIQYTNRIHFIRSIQADRIRRARGFESIRWPSRRNSVRSTTAGPWVCQCGL
jgi:outer membrane receptor protein involved in Fe transport